MVKGKFSVVKGSVVRHFRQDIWSKELGSLGGWRRILDGVFENRTGGRSDR